jgi:hypothetical protein
MSLSQPGQAFRAEVMDYIEQQGSRMGETQPLLASSDVLESLFGKYKLFCQRSPLQEVGRLILTIPLCTVQLTGSLVKRALESVQDIDVDHWAKEVLGTSLFAQRKAVFKRKGGDRNSMKNGRQILPESQPYLKPHLHQLSLNLTDKHLRLHQKPNC